jgi:hypothetical protein
MAVQFSNFKTTIKEFLRLDEEIRSLTKAKTERTRKRDKLSKDIMNYYKKNNINSLNLTDIEAGGIKQHLELIESERHPSVNQKFLRGALAKYCESNSVIDNIINHILKEREESTSVSFKLKRIIPKNKKSSTNSATSSIDPLSLINNEKDKIKERFAKLAEFAIIKDGIINTDEENKTEQDIVINHITRTPNNNNNYNSNYHPENQNYSDDDAENDDDEIDVKMIPVDEPKQTFTSYNKEQNHNIQSQFNRNDEDEYDEDEDDEDEVDLDEIPEENTGYDEDPPQIEEDLEKNKTIKNIITKNIDKMDYQSFVGAIPTPKPISVNSTQQQSQSQMSGQKETIEQKPLNIEEKALQSWNKLFHIAKNNNLKHLNDWLMLQKQKIKLINSREQINPSQFIKMLSDLNTVENSYKKLQFNKEIDTMRNDIVIYVTYRYKK